MSLMEEFNRRRESGNELISGTDFLPFNRFLALDTRAYEDGEIPSKYKELMGLVGSTVLRCNDCILYHLGRSKETGCSKIEIIEALNIALVIGGSIVIPHLRLAMTAMDELFKKDNRIYSDFRENSSLV